MNVNTLTLGATMLTVQDIIDHFGGTHQALADVLGCTREAVTMWGDHVPENRAYQLQVLSKGKLRFEDMPVKRRSKSKAA